jgi:YfiH family protein
MMTNSSERVIIPTIFKHIPQLVAGVSTRHGGKSTQAYQSLNLGLHTDDHPDMVHQNLSLFCHDLGISPQALARSYQVHGDVIWETKESGYTSGYDAIIAVAPGIFAGVGIADCCPILLADPNKKIAAAIHAGWKGTVAQILSKTVRHMMANHGTKPEDILAYIGPCISEAHFEVGDEVAEQFNPAHKNLHGPKWHVNLKEANADQLRQLGVHQIEIDEACTVEHHADFFSHRKEKGVTGRMLAVIGFSA